MEVICAGELKVGMQIPERDGFLFNVEEIVSETDHSITVRLCSDFSSFESHWTKKRDGSPGGVRKTFRKKTHIYVLKNSSE